MITLNMIVKNESHCIRRCLESVLPYIDEAVIVDTGSTDDTIEIITDCLRYKRLVIEKRPWVNFGHNRTEAMQLAKQHTVYNSSWVLLMDADEELMCTSAGSMRFLVYDAYYAWHTVPDGQYSRPFLLWLGLDWSWRGAVHETLAQPHKGCMIERHALTVKDHFDSHRNKSQTKEEKYLSDAKLLIAEFKSGCEDLPRCAFYIAESCRGANKLKEALHWYAVRMRMEGSQEERWWAAHMTCLLLIETKQTADVIEGAFICAHQMRPSRAETLIAWARYEWHQGSKSVAQVLFTKAAALPMTTDTLNVDPRCYKGRLRQER